MTSAGTQFYEAVVPRNFGLENGSRVGGMVTLPVSGP